jgi:hypothetical protein
LSTFSNALNWVNPDTPSFGIILSNLFLARFKLDLIVPLLFCGLDSLIVLINFSCHWLDKALMDVKRSSSISSNNPATSVELAESCSASLFAASSSSALLAKRSILDCTYHDMRSSLLNFFGFQILILY